MMKPLNILYFFSFFVSIQFAATTYINSSFLAQFVSEKNVGLIYALASLIATTLLFLLPRITVQIGNYRVSNIILLAIIFSLVGLWQALDANSGIVMFILYFVMNLLIAFSRDIFIEKYSRDKIAGRARGAALTAINLGFVLAPLAAGILAQKSFNNVYLLAALLTLPAFFFLIPFKNFHDPHYKPTKLNEVWEKFKANPSIFKIYLTNFILQFFYVWMVIFMPIYLNRHIGFSFEQIGLIFTIMLLPFVLIQYPLGRLADKIGEKSILTAGLIIAGLATLVIPFITASNLILWAIILFATRIGAATIEVMTESYFFRKVSASDSELIGFFRNTYPVANIIAPIVASLVFLFTSFQGLFGILAIILFASIYLSQTLNNH